MGYCEICGNPSGFYPLCKYHKILKDKGLVYKDENQNWIEKKWYKFDTKKVNHYHNLGIKKNAQILNK